MDSLASEIEAVLRERKGPLKARQIASQLRRQGRHSLTTRDVNRILYSPSSSDLFERRPDFRWTLASGLRESSDPAEPALSSAEELQAFLTEIRAGKVDDVPQAIERAESWLEDLRAEAARAGRTKTGKGPRPSKAQRKPTSSTPGPPKAQPKDHFNPYANRRCAACEGSGRSEPGDYELWETAYYEGIEEGFSPEAAALYASETAGSLCQSCGGEGVVPSKTMRKLIDRVERFEGRPIEDLDDHD